MKIRPIMQTGTVTLTSPNDFQQLLDRALELAGIDGDDAEIVEVAAVSEAEIVSMNRQYLGHDRPTDVIAFDLRGNHRLDIPDAPEADDEEAVRVAGEIAVCPETARKACGEFQTTPVYEFVLYIVHGLLHIAGHDDIETRDRDAMKQRENEIMVTLTEEFDIEEIIQLNK